MWAASPQGGQARSGRVPARVCGACAACGSAGGDAVRGPQWMARASRRGVAAGSPRGVRGAPSIL
eukprot:4605040-Prymnesium_polylepis.1